MTLTEPLRETARATARDYAHGTDRPLRGYAGAMAVYTGSVLAAAAVARATGRRLPDRLSATDIATLALATHKASRLLSRDAVTSPLRAPFTRFEEAAGAAELNESARGQGARQVVGELVSCPFCLGQWIATGFGVGMVFAPRATRLVAAVLAARAGSDLLHFAHAILHRYAEGPER